MNTDRQIPSEFSSPSSTESDVSQGERLSPQARLLAELAEIEKHGHGSWFVVALAAVVVVFGVLAFFAPSAFWQNNLLQVTLPPRAVYVLLMAAVLLALLDVRREMRLHRRQLAELLSASQHDRTSKIDALTSVLSKDTLRGLLELEILRAERNRRPLAIIMGGVNGLKQVNDHYNQLMGDYVLSQVASILTESVRGCDYVVRCGEQQFLLILPETDAAGAEIVRGRIHHLVAEWDRNNRVGEFSITISLGLYFHVTGDRPEKDVVEAAIRMYADGHAAQRGTAVPRLAS